MPEINAATPERTDHSANAVDKTLAQPSALRPADRSDSTCVDRRS